MESIISLFPMLLGAIVSLTLSIMQAVGLYSIAKRRGIPCPWLAWVPVGHNWVIGAISDHYQEKARGKIKNKRLLLTALAVIIFCLSGWVMKEFFVMAAEQTAATTKVLSLFAVLGIVCVLLVVYDVLLYIALYHIYKSCDPSTATIFLILSIFVSGSSSILLFIQRNKTEGLTDTYIDMC